MTNSAGKLPESAILASYSSKGEIMKSARLFSSIVLVLSLICCVSCSKTRIVQSGGYTYETVSGDPLKARIYTLDNGFKVYMTVYEDAPRIQTCIPVRVGSKNDPAKTTGLAHYLEHLLFKGTDEFGTSNWEKEKPLLDQVTDLYERYSSETDTLTRKRIYQQIDSIAYEGSRYSIAGEYDKMLSSIGAKGTNAFTGNDLTCYVNDIPSNQIRQWLEIEAERFRDPVFRLFHTELEVVYEEKNMSMDRDGSKQWEALYAGLFPSHPYGTQTTLGDVEHLKNPSIQNVYDYFNTYYVPNNMALCLSGDFDPDSMIRMVDETFGTLKAGRIPVWEPPIEDPIAEPVEIDVIGPDMENVMIGFRLPGTDTRDAELMLVLDNILANGAAGLIDLNLKQKQLVINPYSALNRMTDYSVHYLNGRPREGQTLEDVRDHLLAQIDSLKAGAFPDWLPGAVARNLKKNEITQFDRNWSRAFALVMAFIQGKEWESEVSKWDYIYSLTKHDIVDFANEHYGDDYVVVYKRTGQDPNVVKIEKPAITPVELNRDLQSDFLKTLSAMETPEIEPVFLDFQEDIKHLHMKQNIPVRYTANQYNDLFTMYYLADRGKLHDPLLPIAMRYLEYLGTSKYSPEEIKQEFYKLACVVGTSASDEMTYVWFTGLDESLTDALILAEHLLADAQPDKEILDNLINDILKQRADAKLNKETILFGGLYYYAKYGEISPFNQVLTEEELKTLTPEDLIEVIRSFLNFEHRVLYYGPADEEGLIAILDEHHRLPDELLAIPEIAGYEELPTDEDKVYICDYDMKQAQIVLLSKSVNYNRENVALRSMFNQYYGGNMSSVVFQTLRESQALAYSVYGRYQSPYKEDRAHYIFAYIATQGDKLGEAIGGMRGLLNEMAESEESFDASRQAKLRKIQTERITKMSILWNFEEALRQGWSEHDIRKDIYEQVPEMELKDVRSFFDEYIKDHSYTTVLIGDVEALDMDVLEEYGPVQELSLEEVFGY